MPKLTDEQRLEILCQWVEEVPVRAIARDLELNYGTVRNFLMHRLKLRNPGRWGLGSCESALPVPSAKEKARHRRKRLIGAALENFKLP